MSLSLAYNQELEIFKIPKQITEMTKLKKIDLCGVGMEGEIPDLNRLHKLEFFGISRNHCDGEIPWDIFLDLVQHHKLRYIFLGYNKFTVDQKEFPEQIAKMTKIKKLGLGSLKLAGTVPSLADLHQLQEIYINNNKLHGKLPEVSDRAFRENDVPSRFIAHHNFFDDRKHNSKWEKEHMKISEIQLKDQQQWKRKSWIQKAGQSLIDMSTYVTNSSRDFFATTDQSDRADLKKMKKQAAVDIIKQDYRIGPTGSTDHTSPKKPHTMANAVRDMVHQTQKEDTIGRDLQSVKQQKQRREGFDAGNETKKTKTKNQIRHRHKTGETSSDVQTPRYHRTVV